MTDDTKAIIAAIVELGQVLRAEIQDARREAAHNTISLRLVMEDHLTGIQKDLTSVRRSIHEGLGDFERRMQALERKAG